MNLRIRKLRKVLDLTQAEFAAKIGTTASVLTHYETGRRNPSNSVINNICKTFGVREAWLRTGEGEMFPEVSREMEIEAFFKVIQMEESAEFQRRFVSALAKLSAEGWDALEQFVDNLARQHDAGGMDRQAVMEAEARAEAEEYYRKILEEKRRAAGMPDA